MPEEGEPLMPHPVGNSLGLFLLDAYQREDFLPSRFGGSKNIEMNTFCTDAKPFLAVLQLLLAGMDLISKNAFNKGMTSYVFVVYRHAIAAVVGNWSKPLLSRYEIHDSNICSSHVQPSLSHPRKRYEGQGCYLSDCI